MQVQCNSCGFIQDTNGSSPMGVILDNDQGSFYGHHHCPNEKLGTFFANQPTPESNPECKKCGLLKSTIKECDPTECQHDFGTPESKEIKGDIRDKKEWGDEKLQCGVCGAVGRPDLIANEICHKPESKDWEKEFEEHFIPLKPGFSVCKDWMKTLEGTTANYMTILEFIRSEKKKSYALAMTRAQSVYDLTLPNLKEIESQAKEEMKKKIVEWAEKYMKETTKYYGTDKHGIDKEDLINFIKNK